MRGFYQGKDTIHTVLGAPPPSLIHTHTHTHKHTHTTHHSKALLSHFLSKNYSPTHTHTHTQIAKCEAFTKQGKDTIRTVIGAPPPSSKKGGNNKPEETTIEMGGHSNAKVHTYTHTHTDRERGCICVCVSVSVCVGSSSLLRKREATTSQKKPP
jgi:hypothetical protein